MIPALNSVYSIGYTLLMAQRAVLAAKARRSDGVVGEHALRWARQMLETCDVRVRAEGVEAVDWSEPCVVASNHQSLLDIPAILAATGRPFGFLTKKELFRIPAFGDAMLGLGCVAIDRGDPRSALRSLRLAAERVRAGASLVVFPEGTRSADGRLQPFKKGPFHLIQAAKVRTIPVAVVGTRLVLPRDTLLIRAGEVSVRVGAPIEVAGDRASDRERLRAQAEEAVARLLATA
jgi:1-acyl-sn-glycerol-3-phosphate acyltransferase